jgi:gag-pre-integrase-like protein
MDTKTVGITTAYITEVDKLPEEGEEIETDAPAMSIGSKVMLGMWHWRFRHLHFNAILQMAWKGMVKGMEICGDPANTKICKACLNRKQTRTEIQKTMDAWLNKLLGWVFFRCLWETPHHVTPGVQVLCHAHG